MLINPEVTDAEIPRVLNAFLGIAGREEWAKRIRWMDTQSRRNTFVRASGYLTDIHGLELEVARVLGEVQRTGRIDVRARTPERYRLFAFAATVVGIHSRLTTRGQKRLRGMLLNGLRDASGLTPLQQEMSVAAHLFSRGFDVFFSDLETGSGFDFLATKGGVELEVECKRVGLDLGRKVPRWETVSLQKRIDAAVAPIFSQLNRGLVLRVILPSRLTVNETEQKDIAAAVGRACLSGKAVHTKRCDIEVYEFALAGTIFERGAPDSQRVRHFMEERFNVRNREVYVKGQAGKRAVCVSVESRQPDTVVPSLLDQLRVSAATQFTKTRPGLLCVQFIDLTNAQIKRMDSASDDELPRRPSYILRETSKFLASPNRAHVLSIVFRGRGEVGRTPAIRDNFFVHDVQEEGAAYFVTNEFHPLSNDRRYAIFGDETPPQRIIVEA